MLNYVHQISSSFACSLVLNRWRTEGLSELFHWKQLLAAAHWWELWEWIKTGKLWVGKTETMSWKMLRSSAEQRGQQGDKSVGSSPPATLFSLHKVIWPVVDLKILRFCLCEGLLTLGERYITDLTSIFSVNSLVSMGRLKNSRRLELQSIARLSSNWL